MIQPTLDQQATTEARGRASVVRVRVWRAIGWVVSVVRGFIRDDSLLYAAAIAAYALFSLFPLLHVAVSIFAWLAPGQDVNAVVLDLVQDYVPDQAGVEEAVVEVTAEGARFGGLSLGLLLITASRVFDALNIAINRAWDVPKPSLPKKLLLEALMTLLAVAVTVAALALTAAGRSDALQVGPATSSLRQWLDPLFALAPVSLAFVAVIALYRFAPNCRVAWRSVWLPALAVALAYEGLKGLFVWFVRDFDRVSAIYGLVGLAVVVVLWLYFSAVILLFGAQLAAPKRAVEINEREG